MTNNINQVRSGSCEMDDRINANFFTKQILAGSFVDYSAADGGYVGEGLKAGYYCVEVLDDLDSEEK